MDGVSVLLDGGLGALIDCCSISLWWTHLRVTLMKMAKPSHYSLIIRLMIILMIIIHVFLSDNVDISSLVVDASLKYSMSLSIK